MIGNQQARIIGILKRENEKDPNVYLTIKDIWTHYKDFFPQTKQPSYKTIATILHRLAENNKVDFYEKQNKLYYRYKDIQKEVTKSVLKLFVEAFGLSGVTYLSKATKDLEKKDIDEFLKNFE